MKKILITCLIVIAVIVAGVALFRERLILAGVSIMMDRRVGEVQPNQEVSWQKSTLPAPGKSTDEQTDRPPNIILILADDLGWNDPTFNGGGVANGTVPTPHIDAIGKEGAIFTNGYAAYGTCAPSRAALMSGRYPTRFGFEFTPTPPGMQQVIGAITKRRPGVPEARRYFSENKGKGLPFEQMGMPTEEISLAETLKKKGYHTVHIGKWHIGRENGMSPNDQGFDESLLMFSGLYLKEDDPDVVNSKQDFDLIDKFLWASMKYAATYNDSKVFEPRGYLTDYYTEEAVKVIEANKHRPFFLYLAHWAPHTPLQATKDDYDALSHIKLHRERVYAAMIRALDRGVGQVMDALKKNGLDDNTLVMFTSDNGGAGYIGLPEVNKPYRGWKRTFFEGGIHVPYFMRWPGKIPAGTLFDKPVHHFDIYATAAGAAEAPMPSDRKMDGVDLLPFITEPVSADALPHDRLFWRGGHYQTVMADNWKLQKTERPEKIWLFNLKIDPTEQNNVAEQHPDQVKKMLAMIDEHNATQLEPQWPRMSESPIAIDKTLAEPPEPGDEYVFTAN